MGRTIRTYRQRIQGLRKEFSRISSKLLPHRDAGALWSAIHKLSAAGSTLPWADTEMVAIFSMLLEFQKQIRDLEVKISEDEFSSN